MMPSKQPYLVVSGEINRARLLDNLPEQGCLTATIIGHRASVSTICSCFVLVVKQVKIAGFLGSILGCGGRGMQQAMIVPKLDMP